MARMKLTRYLKAALKHQRVPVRLTVSALSPFLFRVENN